MAHSNLVREFVFSNEGLDLVDVFIDSGRTLTGGSRMRAQGALAVACAAPATGRVRRKA
jgi:hypothetical protein